MDTTLLANAAAMTAMVTLLVSLLAPFVESLPGLADTPANQTRHDAALRLLNVVLNVAVVLLFTAASRGLTLADVLPLLLQALAQAAGAHFAYHVVTSGTSGGTALSVPAASVAVALDKQETDFPPGMSLAALGLPLTSSTASSTTSAAPGAAEPPSA